MKSTLIYFLTFVHPETRQVLFRPRGSVCIQYRTCNLPRVGDHITLVFKITVKGNGDRKRLVSYRFKFEIIEIERNIDADDPNFEPGSPPYFEESTSFGVTVIPTAVDYTGMIRVLRQFYKETSFKWREWLRNRVR